MSLGEIVCEDFDSSGYADQLQDEDTEHYKFYYYPANDFTNKMMNKTQNFINSVLPFCWMERNDTSKSEVSEL